MKLNGWNGKALTILAALIMGAVFVGCAKKSEQKTVTGGTKSGPVDLSSLPKKQQEALKQLPEADLKLALEQKVCPVGGGALGSMGVPIKVESKGHTLFVCCEHCKKSAEENPEKYLAILKEKKSKK